MEAQRARARPDKNRDLLRTSPPASSAAMQAAVQPSLQARLEKIVRKVESDSVCTVGELSQEFNLSPAYLQRIFKQQTGVRLGELLAERRLAKAADLLTNSYMSVKEIAYAVGYEHASSFVRAFQRRFTQPPGTYRQLNAEKANE
ncbi:MAG TPA: helix-turn-helix transcriptional regulator [Candidatus Acidoferrales bacterium]|nr:helix-turn-helix transcriptional regulator [Candidatus Acidoferrales bacterium]